MAKKRGFLTYFLSEPSGWWRSKKRPKTRVFEKKNKKGKKCQFLMYFLSEPSGWWRSKKRQKMWIFNVFFVRTERVVEEQKKGQKLGFFKKKKAKKLVPQFPGSTFFWFHNFLVPQFLQTLTNTGTH